MEKGVEYTDCPKQPGQKANFVKATGQLVGCVELTEFKPRGRACDARCRYIREGGTCPFVEKGNIVKREKSVPAV